MSVKEKRDEIKDDQGDPQHAQHRKRAHRDMVRKARLDQVRTADVVQANPTHIACAIRFDPEKEDAPRLVAKGAEFLAEEIKRLAREHEVPVQENRQLARALYALETDSIIPPELYEAVAAVLRVLGEEQRERGEIPRWEREPGEGEGDGDGEGEGEIGGIGRENPSGNPGDLR